MNPSQSTLYHIGSKWDEARHGVISRFFDNHGLNSKNVTRKLIQYIQAYSQILSTYITFMDTTSITNYCLNFSSNIMHLLSGLYMTAGLFTGHCAHYMFINCEKWKLHCEKCPNLRTYPKSWLCDRSYQNFEDKRKAFTSLDNITLIPVSTWLQDQLKQSFLKEQNIITIHNGIDTKLSNSQKTSCQYYENIK